jgi:phosphoribosylaminoimidazole-succinocarboxamide synthase
MGTNRGTANGRARLRLRKANFPMPPRRNLAHFITRKKFTFARLHPCIPRHETQQNQARRFHPLLARRTETSRRPDKTLTPLAFVRLPRRMTSAAIAAALPKTAVTKIDGLPFPRIASGKVREIFDLGDALLLTATDRLSAFDVILPDGIPGKGIVLTQISNWWFAQTSRLIQNHLLPDQAGEFARRGITNRDLQLRSMIVKKLKPLTIECVARGYLIGSGWSSYQKTGEVCGIKLPPGLRQADRLAQPIFTPTTKAPKGQHDEPINDAQGAATVGAALYEKVKSLSLALYQFGHDRAKQAGMILADTKFEFGTDAAGNLFLIDEVLTPDSSRYWPAESYAPNQSPPSYDKQFVRDHLVAIKWDQKPPAPRLPADVITRTQEKYLAALKNLLG